MNVAFLDTSVLIATVGPDGISEKAVAVLSDLEDGLVSSIVMSELRFGVASASDQLVRAERQSRFDAVTSLYGTGIPYDDQAAASYGFLTAVIISKGLDRRARRIDRMIAAAAHSRQLPIVTADTRFRDFADVMTVIEL
jgi:predicted nucleic acid-binding protein